MGFNKGKGDKENGPSGRSSSEAIHNRNDPSGRSSSEAPKVDGDCEALLSWDVGPRSVCSAPKVNGDCEALLPFLFPNNGVLQFL